MRLSALRQALLHTIVFVSILVAAGYYSISTFQDSFEQRTRLELQTRFAQVADDITSRGFVVNDYPNVGVEQVYYIDNGADTSNWIFQQTGFFDGNDSNDNPTQEDGTQQSQNDVVDGLQSPEGIVDSDDSVEWLYYGGEIDSGRLVVAANIGRQELILDTLQQTYTSIGIISILTAALIAIILGIRNQHRMNRVRETLSLAANGDLTARIKPVRDSDDLDQLAVTIDETIGKLEVLVCQSREFSTNIAHDIKTPLTRLRLRLETVLLANNRSDDGDLEIRKALEQADEIIAIFDAFLRIAKLESGETKASFESINLASLAQEVADTYDVVVEDSGRVLKIEIQESAIIKGDRVLLIQMLANLIENSIRYTEKGTELKIVANHRELGLADTGSGIPPEELEKVVQPMYRLEKSRGLEGTGMGLSLAKTIAELHGGKLILSNSQDQKFQGLFVRADFGK